jgi:hypothetical protein
MVRSRARHPAKDEAERRFPRKVDVPVPDIGLGRDLMAMLEWCRQRVAADGWAYHGHTTRQRGEPPQHFARFYFADAAHAEAFARRWRRV